MKIFALKEESSDNSETVVYGWLTYFEEEKEFRIRLCEEIDYWECPIFFSPFVKKGEYVLNVHWSRAWVQQRILPWERQNLQMILQKNQDGSLRCVCVIGADTGVLWTGWLLFGVTELEKTN